MGPGAGYTVVSQKAWRGLPPDIKKEFEAIIPQLRKISWDTTKQDDQENDDNDPGTHQRTLHG